MKKLKKIALPTFLAASGLLTLAAAPAQALEQGDWLFRARAINIDPHSSSTWVRGRGNPALNIPGSHVSVDNAWTLDIDITYMFDKYWGTELLLDIPSKHDIEGRGTIAGLGDVADTKVLPPALILQYHILPDKKFRPYVGLGVDYAIFYDENSKSSLDDALGKTNVDIDNEWGWVAQIGADYEITERWFLNADLKYMGLNVEGKLSSRNPTTGLTDTRKVDVNLDPWVWGLGVGYRY
jgi:outer membrane protein